MNKLEKLLTEGNFAETLMKDGKFVEEAKKILNQETGEDISSQDLEKILSCIAENCTNPKEQNSELSEKELNEVVGGLSNRKLGTLIKVSSTIIGSAIGGAVGYDKSIQLGKKVKQHIAEREIINEAQNDAFFSIFPSSLTEKGAHKFAQFTTLDKDEKELAKAAGTGAGAITGALGGAALGSLICKVTGL